MTAVPTRTTQWQHVVETIMRKETIQSIISCNIDRYVFYFDILSLTVRNAYRSDCIKPVRECDIKLLFFFPLWVSKQCPPGKLATTKSFRKRCWLLMLIMLSRLKLPATTCLLVFKDDADAESVKQKRLICWIAGRFSVSHGEYMLQIASREWRQCRVLPADADNDDDDHVIETDYLSSTLYVVSATDSP